MSYRNLLLEARNAVAYVTVNRPKVLNALNRETMGELEDFFAHVESEESVRGVILTGAGEKAFVAGADINELAQETAIGGQRSSLAGQDVFRKIETLGKPVVAAINGFALGGGLELALSCHLRIAAEGAKLGLPEVKLGAIPGYGGTQRLARLVGRGRALELILTGEAITAQEAHRIGLVNRVVPQPELLGAAEALLSKILSNGPLAVRHVLMAVDRGLDGALAEGLSLEAALFGLLCASDDLKEGMKAFLEKRPANFKGE